MPRPKRGPGGASHLRESGAPPNTPTNSTPHLVMVIFADSGTVCDRPHNKALCTRVLLHGRDGTYSEHLALSTYFTHAEVNHASRGMQPQRTSLVTEDLPVLFAKGGRSLTLIVHACGTTSNVVVQIIALTTGMPPRAST